MVLSIERFEDGSDRARYMGELDQIGARLRTGVDPQLDEADVAHEIEILKLGQQLTWKHGVKGLVLVLLFLSPLFLVIGGAVWLLLRHR